MASIQPQQIQTGIGKTNPNAGPPTRLGILPTENIKEKQVCILFTVF